LGLIKKFQLSYYTLASYFIDKGVQQPVSLPTQENQNVAGGLSYINKNSVLKPCLNVKKPFGLLNNPSGPFTRVNPFRAFYVGRSAPNFLSHFAPLLWPPGRVLCCARQAECPCCARQAERPLFTLRQQPPLCELEDKISLSFLI